MTGWLAFDTPFDAGICDPAWLTAGPPPQPASPLAPWPVPRRQVRAHLHDSTSPLPADLRGAVLMLGNFDGLHLGHQALLRLARARARDERRPLAVMACEPHPKRFFRPDLPPFRLTAEETRYRLFEEAGFDLIWQPRFTAQFAGQSAADFLTLLRRDLGVAAVVTGPDFRFGAGRSGGLADLAAALPLIVPPEVRQGSLRISSSAVRACIAQKDLSGAARLLGRTWSFGLTCRGAGLFGVAPDQLLPPEGRYLARALGPSGRVLSKTPVTITADRRLLADLPARTEALALID